MDFDPAMEGESVGPFVRLASRGDVRIVTLARPERHNALVPELIDGLLSGIATVAADQDARAVVLTARGPNFSTGGDVAAFAAHSGAELTTYARRIVQSLNEALMALVQLDVPVIAAVRGAVTGGSLGFLLASDVVLLAPDVVIRPYYVDVGFSPDGGWTAMLPDRIGAARAAALQYGNDPLHAEQAVQWGLAAGIAESEVEQAALDLAERIAAKKPGAVMRTKRLLREDPSRLQDRLDAELENFVEQIRTPQARGGMNDFLAQLKKRPLRADG